VSTLRPSSRWHRDHMMGEEWQHRGPPLNIKIIFYLTDADVGGGCTYFVPGSQRSPDQPPGTEYLGMGGAAGYDAASRRPQRAMPGCMPVVAKAGSAALFDTRAWHTADANTTGAERWSVITRYSPFSEKQPGPTVEAAEALQRAGALSSPLRLQIFGVGLAACCRRRVRSVLSIPSNETVITSYHENQPAALV
jgi:ectoine hydroxylase-related dioxygenase (phytanoyl-CoA dioxygenase family)